MRSVILPWLTDWLAEKIVIELPESLLRNPVYDTGRYNEPEKEEEDEEKGEDLWPGWSCRAPCAGWPSCQSAVHWWSWWTLQGCLEGSSETRVTRPAQRSCRRGSSGDSPDCTARSFSPTSAATEPPDECSEHTQTRTPRRCRIRKTAAVKQAWRRRVPTWYAAVRPVAKRLRRWE